MRLAILDDYQHVALSMADWSALADAVTVEVFSDTITEEDELVARLLPFDIINVMRERTPLTRHILARLPNLRLIASTGPRNASIETAAAAQLGIDVLHTGYSTSAAIELTWALILASARNIVDEAVSLRMGGWQTTIGTGLRGKTIGILGLGGIGREVARVGAAFGMDLIAWSPNLTVQRAVEAGARLVPKAELFAAADILSVHMVLSPATRGLVDRAALETMKRSAILVNTSRGALVDEAALIEVLKSGGIRAAAVDVFSVEPLPPGNEMRSLPTMLATPHIGYVTDDLYRTFYGDTVRNIVEWIGSARGRPA